MADNSTGLNDLDAKQLSCAAWQVIMMHNIQPHTPVLVDQITAIFSYLKEGVFVDGTLGAGGHSLAIVSKLRATNQESQVTSNELRVIGIDKDKSALEVSCENIKKKGLNKIFILIHNDFKNILDILKDLKIKSIDGAILDLGVSSMQFDNKERGFSFSDPDQFLDMRMNHDQTLTASKIVNYYSQSQIEDILNRFGEEPFANKIAREICLQRKNHRINTVGDLLHALKKAIPVKFQNKFRIHYATKTFQALRIEVNHELENLEKATLNFISILKPGGRLAVISFHSLEDRIVKNTFRNLAKDCICPSDSPICTCNHKPEVKLLTKHPLTPREQEIRQNPRSRSAKLRVVEKI